MLKYVLFIYKHILLYFFCIQIYVLFQQKLIKSNEICSLQITSDTRFIHLGIYAGNIHIESLEYVPKNSPAMLISSFFCGFLFLFHFSSLIFMMT